MFPSIWRGVLLATLVLTAGCLGQPQETVTVDPTASPTTTETEPAGPTTDLTTTETLPAPLGDEDPDYGTQLLQPSTIDREIALSAAESKRSAFENLSSDQREAFELAMECECSVKQTAFSFYNKDRIEYVRYEGTWYFARVAIV